MIQTLSNIANSHFTNIFIALFLTGTSLYQIYTQLQTDSHQIGAHHGVALYGLVLLIKEFLNMLQTTDKAITHIKESE
ncbi:hypothetical protein [Pseudoalteromonas denitrificans]|uniref:Uncharacterized protein n=1 Tax=Pseudoalteromonas denitrificans DSM 6059 TaxID=1123010 RepID=A0A1I1MXE0_9GAMM|nr:hypothetical protein [Pseudoalteromonas denitrificans]SFC90029.1 hypothetical protein SAMN02745724_02861 [Pseudoalteromonas denitrificans DSM 6059]